MKEDNNVSLNAFALVGFVLGLLSIGLYWVLGIIPVLAIIFSIIGLIGAKKMGQKGKGLAITGLILGIIYISQFGLKIILKNNNYFQNYQTQTTQQTIQEANYNTQVDDELLELLQGKWETVCTILEITTYETLTVNNNFIEKKQYSLSSTVEYVLTGYITLVDSENFTITFNTGITQKFRYDKSLNSIVAENGTGMLYKKIH